MAEREHHLCFTLDMSAGGVRSRSGPQGDLFSCVVCDAGPGSCVQSAVGEFSQRQ